MRMTVRTWYGDGVHVNLGAGGYEVPRPTSGYFLTSLTPDAAAREVTLSDARRHRPGVDLYAFYNLSAVDTIAIKDDGGNTIHTLATLSLIVLHLPDNTTANGIWVAA